MDPEVLAFAQVMAILVPSVAALAAVVVISLRLNRPRTERPVRQLSDDRLERLEHAVDAIAIEVERIAEGQRFVTKLLSDRAPIPEIRRPSERVNTPH